MTNKLTNLYIFDTEEVYKSFEKDFVFFKTQVRSLGWEDPLEKEMATHSSTLAWRIPWTEEPGGLQSRGCRELDTTERLTHNT